MKTILQYIHFLSWMPILRIASASVFIGLAACGGGGSDPAAATGEKSTVNNTLTVKAQPGDIVTLLARENVVNPNVADYQWTQMSGPQVDVGDSRERLAHFVMPPVDENKELTFLVDVHQRDGSMISEMHTVSAASPSHGRPHPPPVVTAQYVVFIADKDLDNRYDLYLAMLDGSAVYRLNDPLTPGGRVYEFHVSPDRRYVVYAADQDIQGRQELYVARADGSGVAKVSGGNYSYAPTWSPDSSRLAYIEYIPGNSVYEVFTNRPDGTTRLRVSGDRVAGSSLSGYAWSPDSTRLAYLADQNTRYVTELFSSRVDGTGNVRVSGPLVAGGGVYTFAWAPDSTRIAYIAKQLMIRSPEIFTSYPDGTGNVRVSHVLPSTNDYIFGSISWAPDSSRIAYQGYYNYYYSSGSYYTYYYSENIYTTRPDGTGVTQISAVPVMYNEYRYAYQYTWAPDSSRIAYLATQNEVNVHELFTSGPDGSGNVRVSGNLVTGGSVAYDFAWAPDSSRIAYRADQRTDNTVELFTSDPIGNGNVRVSGNLATGGNVYNYSWSPDGRYLAYMADQLSDEVFELYTATPDGSLNPRVSGPMIYNGDVQGFAWSADANRLVYRADQLLDEQYELFVAAPDGNAVNDNISGTLTANGDVLGFATQ